MGDTFGEYSWAVRTYECGPNAAGPCHELDIVFKSETLAGEEVRVESVETEPGVFAHRLYAPDGRDHVLARSK